MIRWHLRIPKVFVCDTIYGTNDANHHRTWIQLTLKFFGLVTVLQISNVVFFGLSFICSEKFSASYETILIWIGLIKDIFGRTENFLSKW